MAISLTHIYTKSVPVEFSKEDIDNFDYSKEEDVDSNIDYSEEILNLKAMENKIAIDFEELAQFVDKMVLKTLREQRHHIIKQSKSNEKRQRKHRNHKRRHRKTDMIPFPRVG